MTTPLDPTIADQALADLRTLLRFDTTNPPGNEGPAIEWIAQQLAKDGIESTIVTSDGRPNLIARLAGDGSAGGPLLLAGHVDVVPVDRAHWSQDPFAANLVDGYVYARGAIDMKYSVIMAMVAMQQAKRSGRTPNRDLIFAAVSDEEAGCTHGSKFLVERHPGLVEADYMIGEFGGFSLDIGGVRYYPVQVAEKGVCQMRMTAFGEPGHGAIPHRENAVVRLAEAIAKLGSTRLPQKVVPVMEAFIRGLAAHQPAPAKHVLPLLLNPAMSGFVLSKVMPDPTVANSMASLLSNTVSPTMLDAGTAKNVIPGAASAMLDGRLLPGQTKDDLLREVRAVIGPDLDLEIVTYREGRSNEGFESDALYQAICDTIRRHDPSGVPVPYMVSGFTDAQQFGRLGMQCYGYAPVRFPAEDDVKFAKLVHGHDERIHAEGFRWGVGCFVDLVHRFVGLTDG